jgi:hypothetical protein
MQTRFPFDPTKIDLTKIDLSRIDVPGLDRDALVSALRDAAYITIGFGVLTVQKAQVRRRELVAALSARFGTSKETTESLLSSIETELRGIVSAVDDRIEAVEARIDTAVAAVEQRLPQPAGAWLSQVHGVARAARRQVRGLVANAA